MPIPHYRLDDRSFEDLVREMVSRIPGHTPEWTNVQEGDPGRTLIDLFAWLGDTILYRANLLPERQRLEFLRLLNVHLRSARASSGLVRLDVANDRVDQPVEVRRYTPIQGPVDFETIDEVTVLPLFGQVYVKRNPTPAEEAELQPLLGPLEDVYGISPLHDPSNPPPGARSLPYVTTPLFSAIPHDPDGFDFVRNTRDRSLWVALLAASADAAVRSRARDALAPGTGGARLLSIGVQPRLTIPEFDEIVHNPLDPRDLWQWAMPSDRASATDDPFRIPYVPLQVTSDTTDGFTKAGVVKLALPHPDDVRLPPNSVDDDKFAGTGNRPPRIDDEETASKLVGWIRLRPRTQAESLALTWMGINAVGADQRRTVENVVVATSDGAPDQVVDLPAVSIEPGSFVLEVEEPGQGYRAWTAQPLHEGGPYDRIYELDDEAGVVKFGDGLRGAVPEPGSRVRLVRMRYGGGRQGNVPAGNLTAISHPRLKLHQPIDMKGGDDAESLETAERRIPSELRHRHRAVTLEDYEEIARYTPGVEVGRVAVLPKFKPQQRLENIKGVVSVMVLPKALHRSPPNPRPDRNMLARVHAYLDARRPIGVELYVIGTEYVPIGLSIAVYIRDGFPRNEVLSSVEDALRDHLWSLGPGGHEQEGWPLGRTVVAQELEVIVARVKGVLTVNEVILFRRDQNQVWEPVPVEGGGQALRLEAWQLPELLAVIAEEAKEASEFMNDLVTPTSPGPGGDEDGVGDGTVGDGAGGLEAIAIPVVPEMCK